MLFVLACFFCDPYLFYLDLRMFNFLLTFCGFLSPFWTQFLSYKVQIGEFGIIFFLNSNLLGEYAGTQGLGLLRLHSTFRHDLKIYASDEGR